MDRLVRATVKCQVMFIAVNAQLANMNRSGKKRFVDSGLDVEALIFLQLSRADFQDSVRRARSPEIDILPYSHGFCTEVMRLIIGNTRKTRSKAYLATWSVKDALCVHCPLLTNDVVVTRVDPGLPGRADSGPSPGPELGPGLTDSTPCVLTVVPRVERLAQSAQTM